MSDTVFTISEAGPDCKQLDVTRFSGGPKYGMCVQITQEMHNAEYGYIQLTRTDWRILRAVIDAQFQDDAK